MWYINEELYHHGIQGQKWGVRRYQNEDGSYTDAGRRRYNDGDGGGRRNYDNRRRNSGSNYGGIQNDYDSGGRDRDYTSEGEEFMKQLGKTFALAAVSSLGSSLGSNIGRLPTDIANASINNYYKKQSDARQYDYNTMLNKQKAEFDAEKTKFEHDWQDRKSEKEWLRKETEQEWKEKWNRIHQQQRRGNQ